MVGIIKDKDLPDLFKNRICASGKHGKECLVS